jgi:hypothetical protein
MNIHPFIFSWKGHYERTLALEKIFLKIFGRVTVINSEEEHRPGHWINLTDEAYFAKQFITACDLLDGDVMFHVQADVSYSDWEHVIGAAKKYYKKYNFGVYAPNIDYTTIVTKDIDFDIKLEDRNLKFVSVTDCSAWFIDRSIIEYFKSNFKEAYLKTKFGWGVCWCISSISILLGIPILRDYAFTLQHPKHTNYNSAIAGYRGRMFLKYIQHSNEEIWQNINQLRSRDKVQLISKIKTRPFYLD